MACRVAKSKEEGSLSRVRSPKRCSLYLLLHPSPPENPSTSRQPCKGTRLARNARPSPHKKKSQSVSGNSQAALPQPARIFARRSQNMGEIVEAMWFSTVMKGILACVELENGLAFACYSGSPGLRRAPGHALLLLSLVASRTRDIKTVAASVHFTPNPVCQPCGQPKPHNLHPKHP